MYNTLAIGRSHGWANWIPIDDLITAVPTHERGHARDIANELKSEPYIRFHRKRGMKINNSRVDLLADELHNVCEYSEFRITVTLSHFGALIEPVRCAMSGGIYMTLFDLNMPLSIEEKRLKKLSDS